MIKCPNCGKKNPYDAYFCGECGSSLPEPENYCPECDIIFKKGEKFCTQCGHILVNKLEYFIELERLEEQRFKEQVLEEERKRLLRNTKICPKCHVTLGKKAKKCPKWGYNFK